MDSEKEGKTLTMSPKIACRVMTARFMITQRGK